VMAQMRNVAAETSLRSRVVSTGIVVGVVVSATLCLAAQAAHGEPPSLRAVRLGGEPFAARVAQIDADWTIHFETDAASQVLAAKDLVRWGEYADSFRLMQVVLADGSLLVAQIAQLADERLAVDGEMCGRLEIPLARVRGVIVDPPPSPAARDRLWEQLAAVQGVEDQLILKNGDVLRGVLKTVQQRDETALSGSLVTTFAVQGRDVTIPESRISAMIFNPALVDAVAKPAFCVLTGFRDGSLLRVVQVAAAEPLLRLTLAGGVTVELDPLALQSDLTLLQPLGERITYLSDLPPLSYKHIPYLQTTWPLGRDRSVTDQRLRHGGATYIKGLGMHSASRVAYRLDNRWRRFEAELALDDTAGRQGSVVFRVFLGDDADRWQRAYESPVVRGGEPPLPMAVELGAARAIALIVDFADHGDVLDRAAWLNARLIE
jgi:hypothetical protein